MAKKSQPYLSLDLEIFPYRANRELIIKRKKKAQAAA